MFKFVIIGEKSSHSVLCVVLSAIQTQYIENLSKFYISLVSKYTSFGHSANWQNINRRLTHSTPKYGRSPQNNLPNLIWRHNNFFLIKCFDYLSIENCINSQDIIFLMICAL